MDLRGEEGSDGGRGGGGGGGEGEESLHGGGKVGSRGWGAERGLSLSPSVRRKDLVMRGREREMRDPPRHLRLVLGTLTARCYPTTLARCPGKPVTRLNRALPQHVGIASVNPFNSD